MNTLQIVPKTETIPHFLTTGVDLVSSFLRGRNQKTIDAYRKDLEDFRAFPGSEEH